jgi:hypothetical protein
MLRATAFAYALLMLQVAGCAKHAAPETKATGSATAGSATPSGSGSGVDTTAIDTMVNDMMSYTEKVLPMMLAFDGDCTKQANRMLELEPLAQKIRAEGAPLESDAAAQASFKAAIAIKKPEVMARMKAKLDAAGTTEEAIGKTEKAINDKCGNDPTFQEAMNRVGLRKKKS